MWHQTGWGRIDMRSLVLTTDTEPLVAWYVTEVVHEYYECYECYEYYEYCECCFEDY